AGTVGALEYVSIFSGDRNGVAGIDRLIVFIRIAAIQTHPAEGDLGIGQFLGPKGAQERRWCHNGLETSGLGRLFVIIDRVFIPNGLGKLTNGAFFNVITDPGRFHPQPSAIKALLCPPPPIGAWLCVLPAPTETCNYTWNLVCVLSQSGRTSCRWARPKHLNTCGKGYARTAHAAQAAPEP